MTTQALTDADFVIVTYNSLSWIERLLGSIRSRSGNARFSVVLVDNASPDGTGSHIRDRHPWVKLIQNEQNRWLSPAINQGIRATGGRYVIIMNPDCELVTNDWVSEVVAFLDEHPSVGILGPRLLDEDGSVQFTGARAKSRSWALAQAVYLPSALAKLGRRPEWRWEPDWQRDSLRKVDQVSGACLVIRRSMLEQIGSFDEGFRLYYEEDDISLRARRAGWDVVLFPDVELIHGWAHATSRMDPSERKAVADESFFWYFTKHEGRSFGALLRAIRKVADGSRQILHTLPWIRHGS
jgi:GT2 family glycosyltransferase